MRLHPLPTKTVDVKRGNDHWGAYSTQEILHYAFQNIQILHTDSDEDIITFYIIKPILYIFAAMCVPLMWIVLNIDHIYQWCVIEGK